MKGGKCDVLQRVVLTASRLLVVVSNWASKVVTDCSRPSFRPGE